MTRGKSLAARVALASAGAASLGGLVAALTAGITARELVGRHETTSLRAATKELAEELRDELYDDDDDDDDAKDEHKRPDGQRSIDEMLDEELDDLKLFGATAAIRRDHALVAGDPRVPELPFDTCRLFMQPTVARVCAVRFEGGVLALSVPAEGERDRGELLTRALLVGLLGSALCGGVLSYFLARWALVPLSVLRERVRAISPSAPDAEPLTRALKQQELEELRRAVHELVAQLVDALAQAQRFSAEAAHELRTPLTTIAGELELLADDTALLDRAALSRVRRQVSDLIALVQRLLILAIPKPIEAPQAEIVELGDIIESVRELLPPEDALRLRVEAQDDASVSGDAALLRALLGNAVDNALKFSSGEVLVRLSRAGDRALLDVSDNGQGVSDEDRARVFEPFYRSKKARASTVEGHGLGLALIARVASMHRGEARFLPRETGATLRIALPLWQPSSPGTS